MSKPFKGIINVDIRDSVPDWAPFEPPKAPDGAPNVVYIVLDDVGFSAMSSYGGPIPTPNIDRIVDDGRALHAVAHDGAVLADALVPADRAQPHAQQHGVHHRGGDRLPERERDDPAGERACSRRSSASAGWNTYMVGKWHLCPDDEMNLAVHAAQLADRPRLRALLWVPRRGDEPVVSGPRLRQPPRRPAADSPEEGYHLTEDLTDKALEFIKDAKAVAPEKPFFLYYAPGACHAPHHAPKEWIEKFKGQFDMGYEAIREQTLARQKELGHRPAGHRAPADQPDRHAQTRTGPTGSRSRRSTSPGRGTRCTTTRSGCSAGWPRCTPDSWRTPTHQIGRLLDYLEETGQRENTMIVLVSDNGASGEGGPNGSVNEMKFANGIPDSMEQNLAMLDELGGTKTYNHYPNGWAMAFNTPFKMWKRYEFNGGTSDPCIISWPEGIKARGEIREQYHHAIDLVPTILDVLGVEPPETIEGHVQSRLRRRQHALQLRRRRRAERARDPVLLDARLAGDLARRLEGRHDPSDAQRLGPLQRRRVGALPHRRRPLRAARPRRRASPNGSGADQPVVRRGRRQRRVPARRPLGARDPH